MLCQMCLEAEATIHVVDAPPGETREEADYCQRCHHLKNADPPARPRDFPRPRFTIKHLMILAGTFAIPNAAVMLIMRSGLISAAPAQRRDRTLHAFLGVNFVCGVMVASLISSNWVSRVGRYKRTGGLLPDGQPRVISDRGFEYQIEQARALWKGASRLERFFQVLYCAWNTMIWILCMFSRMRMSWFSNWWLSVCAVISLIAVGHLIILSAIVASTRRR